MTKKNILIIGVTGELGEPLFSELNKSVHLSVLGTSRSLSSHENIYELDIDKSLHYWPDLPAIDVIIYCVSGGDIISAEENASRSYKLNFIGLRDVCDHYKTIDTQLIMISSQRVFSGAHSFLSTNDVADARLNYGKHKLLAEQYILENNGAVLRCTKLISKNNKRLTFFKDSLLSQSDFKASKNVMASLVSISCAIKAILQLIKNEKSGVFHLSGYDQESWFAISNYMAEYLNKPFTGIFPEINNFDRAPVLSRYVTLESSPLFVENNIGNRSVKQVVQDWLSSE